MNGIALLAFAIPVVYGIRVSLHFGWHEHKRTDAEMICFGIGYILLELAFLAVIKS